MYEDKFLNLFDEQEVIGEGMHGIVKVCQHKKTKQQFAVKVVKTQDYEIIQAVFMEFEMLKFLDHPNIIYANDIYHNERRGHIRMVIEYVRFPSLQQILREKKSISEEQLREIFYLLIKTLNYLHQNNIVHRDINPSNILVDLTNNNLKLIDFGIAKRKIEDQLWTPTGTPNYKAPEILRCETYNEKADIWSAGVVLYQCLSGKLPFQQEQKKKMFIQMETGKFDLSNQAIWKNVSIEARNLLRDMLSARASERPSAQEVLSHPWLINYVLKDIQQQQNFQEKIKLAESFLKPSQIINLAQDSQENCPFSAQKINGKIIFDSPDKKQKLTRETFSDRRTVYNKF